MQHHRVLRFYKLQNVLNGSSYKKKEKAVNKETNKKQKNKTGIICKM